MGQLHFITSDMPGAPAVPNTVQTGAITAALDAALVNGFNQGACTLTRAGAVVTITRANHGFVNQQMIEVTGAAEAAYNGKFRVTVVSASTATYTLAAGATPATPATGSPLCKTASLGWSIAFTATNRRSYRPAAGPRDFLSVDDTDAGNTALLRAYTNMTSVTAGTGAYPDLTLAPTCRFPRPRTSTNTNQQKLHPAWIVVGDEKRMFFIVTRDTHATGSGYIDAGGYSFGMFFGAFRSYALSDTWNSLLFGPAVDAADSDYSLQSLRSSLLYTGQSSFFESSQNYASYVTGPFAARSFDGVAIAKVLQLSAQNLSSNAALWSQVSDVSAVQALQCGVGSSPTHGGYVLFGTTLELVEYLNQAGYNGYALRGKFPCLQLAPNTASSAADVGATAAIVDTWQSKVHPAQTPYGEIYTCLCGGSRGLAQVLGWPLADMDAL